MKSNWLTGQTHTQSKCGYIDAKQKKFDHFQTFFNRDYQHKRKPLLKWLNLGFMMEFFK